MKTTPWGQYERLRPAEIEAIRARTPVAYLPWGALEWHSYHNPIGLDGMQAHGQSCALAARTGGVVLPPIYIGTDTIKPFKGFGHTIEHAASTVRTLCREFLGQLAEEGFRVIVLITGHCGGGHVDALREAVEQFTGEHDNTEVLLFPSFEPMQDRYPSNHAALGETSFQLLFDPLVVDLAALPQDRVTTLDEDGVWGEDPRNATAEHGQTMLEVFLDRTLPEINDRINRYAP
jgi:creatinine amidohydrolase